MSLTQNNTKKILKINITSPVYIALYGTPKFTRLIIL